MAHGSMADKPIPNYVCKESIRLLVRKEDNSMVEHYFPVGEKVDFKGFYGFYSDSGYSTEYGHWHKLCQTQIESVDDDNKLFYELNEDYYGEYLYVDKVAVNRFFRPIVHKHLTTTLFTKEGEMNEFLATLKIDCLKDIKIGNNAYLVIYIDMGDDE